MLDAEDLDQDLLQLQISEHSGSQAPLQQQDASFSMDAVWQRFVQQPGDLQAQAKLDRTATPASVLTHAQRVESGSTSSPLRSLSHLSSFGGWSSVLNQP